MRVLHVNDHLAPKGGVETYLLSTLPRLEADGLAQAVVYGSGEPELVPRSFHMPLLSSPGWGKAGAVRRELSAIMDQFNPDVVHLHNIHNADAVEHLLNSKPVVLTSHDFRYLCPASNFYLRKTQTVCERSCSVGCLAVTLKCKCMTLRPYYSWKYYRRVKRVTARFGDFAHLIAPSAGAAERFRRDGFPDENISVLPYFCRIDPLETPREVPTDHNMLYLGRLSENKGWHHFVEALGMLPDDVSGTIIGNVTPAGQQGIEDLAERHGCRDRLFCSPWATQAEIADRLLKASVLIFPSLWPETLGIVGLEAMAHGVPVVASDIGGVPEWLQDGQNGYRVPPGDSAAIANAVRKILADPERAGKMGQHGLRYLRERFLPDQHLAQLKKIYEAAA